MTSYEYVSSTVDDINALVGQGWRFVCVIDELFGKVLMEREKVAALCVRTS